MSQNKTPTIDPTIISGTQLTGIIDDNTDTELTTNSGTMRPSYAKAGTLWLNTANAALWDLNFFDGSVDVTLGRIDPVAHTYVGLGTDQYLLQDGSEPMLGNLDITTNAPSLRFIETDASVDNGRWDCYVNNETLAIRAVNDANSASGSVITIFRTGVTIDATLITAPSTDTVPVVANDIPNLDYVNSAVATLTNKTLTSPVLNGGLSGTAFLDDDTMAADSAIAVASQQSIKAYIDAKRVMVSPPEIFTAASTINAWQTINIATLAAALSATIRFRINTSAGNSTSFRTLELYVRKTGSGLGLTAATQVIFKQEVRSSAANFSIRGAAEFTTELDVNGDFDLYIGTNDTSVSISDGAIIAYYK